MPFKKVLTSFCGKLFGISCIEMPELLVPYLIYVGSCYGIAVIHVQPFSAIEIVVSLHFWYLWNNNNMSIREWRWLKLMGMCLKCAYLWVIPTEACKSGERGMFCGAKYSSLAAFACLIPICVRFERKLVSVGVIYVWACPQQELRYIITKILSSENLLSWEQREDLW